MTKKEKAQAIAIDVDCSYNLDLTTFGKGELKSLRNHIDDLLKTGIDPSYLTSPGDLLYDDDGNVVGKTEEE
jgi:hypothetical protein